jgi:hypothetical protein
VISSDAPLPWGAVPKSHPDINAATLRQAAIDAVKFLLFQDIVGLALPPA